MHFAFQNLKCRFEFEIFSQVELPDELNVKSDWDLVDNYNEWKARLVKGSVDLPVYAYFQVETLEQCSSKSMWLEKLGRYLEAHPVVSGDGAAPGSAGSALTPLAAAVPAGAP